jgi:hypothetical protein
LRSVIYRALDGSYVNIRTSLDVERPVSTFLNLRIGSHLQEFGSGSRDFAAANAHDVGVQAFRETYRFQGGTLRLGTAVQFDPRIKARDVLIMATWEGRNTSLYTFAYNTTNSSDLLAILNRVRLSESSEGLALAPVDAASTPVADVTLVKELPMLGLLQIHPLDSDLMRSLPSWRGRQVAGGELFVDGETPERRTFVVAGKTAITHVVPDAEHDVDALLSALAELQVDWTQGQ